MFSKKEKEKKKRKKKHFFVKNIFCSDIPVTWNCFYLALLNIKYYA